MCHKSIYMAPLTEKQQQAYGLFFNTDKNSTEIADILDVNRKTVYLWIKNGKWEEMKLAANVAPGMILLDVYGHIGAINNKIRQREADDRIPTMEEVEKLRKLLGMVKNINKNHIGSYMESFTELVRFIGGTDEVQSWKVAEYAKRYVRGNFGDMEMETSVKSKKQVAWVKENLSNIEEEENSEGETERRAEAFPERETEQRAEAFPERETEQGEEGIEYEEIDEEQEMEVEIGNENWEYGTIWGDDGAMMGQREAMDFYNQEVPEAATVVDLELVGENSGSGFSSEKTIGAFGTMSIETEEETRHNNILKQAEALALKFGYTLPEAKPKPKNEFGLTVNGYWTEDNVYGLPDIPGIYAMYECETDHKTYYTKPIKLLAIGESHNIKADVYKLLENTLDTQNPNLVSPQQGWRGAVAPGRDICFSYIKCEFSDLNRLATALVENMNPPFNKPIVQFNYAKTTIVTFGQNLLFPKVIRKQKLAA